jgi:hypothetical protein
MEPALEMTHPRVHVEPFSKLQEMIGKNERPRPNGLGLLLLNFGVVPPMHSTVAI